MELVILLLYMGQLCNQDLGHATMNLAIYCALSHKLIYVLLFIGVILVNMLILD